MAIDIDKAIKNLTPLTRDASWIIDTDVKDAIKLGIEALKRLKEHREEHIDITFRALPGETTGE